MLPTGEKQLILGAFLDYDQELSFENSKIKELKKLKLFPDYDDSPKECLSAKHDFEFNSLELTPSDCQNKFAVVCSMLKNPEKINITTLSFLLDPKYKDFKKQSVALKKRQIKSIFKFMDQTKAYEAMFSNLWYSTLPCFDIEGITAEKSGESSILKYCEWKGMQIPCSDIFTKFPSDQGMCCSFNIKAAEEIFNGETYPKLVTKLQEADKAASFDKTNVPKKYLDEKEPRVTPGRNKGLVLMLDAHTNVLSPGSVDSDYVGFLGLISPRGSFPLINEEGFEIRPGHNNIVALSGSRIDANEDLRNLDKSERNCLFPDENSDLKIHKNYSNSNCLFECSLMHAKMQMKVEDQDDQTCIPWFFPSEEESINICDPWQSVEFFKYMANISDDSCSHCLADCSTTIYESSITTVPFRRCDSTNLGMSKLCNLGNPLQIQPTIFGKQIGDEYLGTQNPPPSFIGNFESSIRQYQEEGTFSKIATTYDAYDKDIAMVQIYFKKSTIFQIESQPKKNWLDFTSDAGGLLGIVLGMGFVSFIEILWLGLRLASRKLNLTNWII